MDLTLLAAGGQVLKDAHAAFKKVQEIKQNSELCDMLEKILDLRQTVFDARHEIIDLRAEIDELRKRKDIEDHLQFDSKIGVYFKKGDTEKIAYCIKCWKKDESLVPMTASDWGYVCSVCDSQYKNPDYVAPSSTVTSRRLAW